MAATEPHTFTVSWRASLQEGDWADLSNIECPELTMGLAPTIDQATLIQKFGHVDGAYVERLDLRNKYVHIHVENIPGSIVYDEVGVAMTDEETGEPVLTETGAYDWYGVVLQEQLERWNQEADGDTQRLFGGNLTMTAFGLEWFLAHETINHTIVHPAARIERVLGFNTGFGDARDVEYADRANKDSRSNSFAEDKDHCDLWNAAQIMHYLLSNHAPKDKDGNDAPAEFVLASASFTYLAEFFPTVRCEGRSLWQVMNDVISQSRGLTWWITYEDDANQVQVHVSSQATEDVTLPGGGLLPKADDTASFSNVDEHYTHPTIQRDSSKKYDQIFVRGALRRSVFTVGFENSTLAKSWRTEDEDAYKLAAEDDDPAINDRFRQANRFERVYQCYHIPTTWNGTIDGDQACPKFAPGSVSIIGVEALNVASLRLLPALPIKVGFDYTDANAPVDRDPTNIRPEFQKPFAIIDVGEDNFRFTHRLNANREQGGQSLTAYYLHVLNGTPGMQLTPSGGMPHAIASADFPGEDTSSSEQDVELDFHTLRCTVCAEWDAYCEGYYPTVAPSTKPLSKLFITLDEQRARFDWLAEHTVYDIQVEEVEGEQVPVVKEVETAGALRDDRELCEDIARFAFEWYSLDRATVQFNFNRIAVPAEIGTLITTIGHGAAQETVNCVVSQITHDLERGTTQMLAGFAELDFAEL